MAQRKPRPLVIQLERDGSFYEAEARGVSGMGYICPATIGALMEIEHMPYVDAYRVARDEARCEAVNDLLDMLVGWRAYADELVTIKIGRFVIGPSVPASVHFRTLSGRC